MPVTRPWAPWLGLVLAGCPAPSPRPPPPPPPVPASVAVPTGWLPLRGGRWISESGLRVEVVDGIARIATERLPGPGASVAIPAGEGGGYLFWEGSQVWRGATFSGPLQPLVTVPFDIDTVGVGAGAALLTSANRAQRYMVGFDGTPRPIEPLGAVSIAATEGLFGAVTAWGTVETSPDGAHWTERIPPRPATSLARDGDALLVRGEGEPWQITAAGDARRERPRPPFDGAFRELALTGLVQRDGTAWIVDGGPRRVFLDRAATEPAAGPRGLGACVATSSERFVCRTGEVLRVEADGLSVERRFAPLERAFVDDARVVIPQTCAGDVSDRAACVGDATGWREVRHRQPVRRWIPSALHGALPVTDRGLEGFAAPPSRQLEPPGEAWVDDRVWQREDGTIRIRGEHRFFTWDAAGVAPDRRRFGTLGGWGERALGFDGAAWQSTDGGERWTATEPAPDAVSEHPIRCGRAGCTHAGWARLGWVASSPVPRLPVDAAPRDGGRIRTWDRELRCTSELRQTQGRAWPVFAAPGMDVDEGIMGFQMVAQQQGAQRRFRWTLPFDPGFRLHEGRAAADLAAGLMPPAEWVVDGVTGGTGWLLGGRAGTFYLGDRLQVLAQAGAWLEESAVRIGPDRFLALALVGPGLVGVVALQPGESRVLRTFPLSAYVPRLGLDAGGAPGLLYFAPHRRALPPRADPDLWLSLRDDGALGAPTPLPPWTEAVLADDPRCEAAGIRAVAALATIVVSVDGASTGGSLLVNIPPEGPICIEAAHGLGFHLDHPRGPSDGGFIARWGAREEGQIRLRRWDGPRHDDRWTPFVGPVTCRLVGPE